MKMTNTNEQVQVDYRAGYIERENEVNDLIINKQQLHHLLIHVEEQLEEVEGIYQMIKEHSKKSYTNNYLDNNLAQLRSLIEITQEHNYKFMEKK